MLVFRISLLLSLVFTGQCFSLYIPFFSSPQKSPDAVPSTPKTKTYREVFFYNAHAYLNKMNQWVLPLHAYTTQKEQAVGDANQPPKSGFGANIGLYCTSFVERVGALINRGFTSNVPVANLALTNGNIQTALIPLNQVSDSEGYITTDVVLNSTKHNEGNQLLLSTTDKAFSDQYRGRVKFVGRKGFTVVSDFDVSLVHKCDLCVLYQLRDIT
jgi:phosphatidate phosphatase APP1